jgi:peptide chain release factor 1
VFDSQLRDIEARYEEVNLMLASPEIASDPDRYRVYAKEHGSLREIVGVWRELQSALLELVENEELLSDEDEEMREMAALEKERLTSEIEVLQDKIRVMLIPKDPLDDKNIMLEVRAGTGGDEAALFAGDLFRMYTRYAEARGWKVEILSSNRPDSGGYKEVVGLFSGTDVYSRFKFEGGVHRVQRVPTTESQGRIHTSACTVAVMPEAEEVDVQVLGTDLRIDTFRASGAGGQHVNKTESAIRITHLPSGMVVSCQDEKSQHKNKARALKILKTRLLEYERQSQADDMAVDRRSQVGSGDRSERIRTYNYPQNRVSDHRINLTLYKLDQVVEGALDEVLEPLMQHYQAEALKDLGGENT